MTPIIANDFICNEVEYLYYYTMVYNDICCVS